MLIRIRHGLELPIWQVRETGLRAEWVRNRQDVVIAVLRIPGDLSHRIRHTEQPAARVCESLRHSGQWISDRNKIATGIVEVRGVLERIGDRGHLSLVVVFKGCRMLQRVGEASKLARCVQLFSEAR